VEIAQVTEVSRQLLGIYFGIAFGCNVGSGELLVSKNFGNIQATGKVE
jgi:hypothetical protein